MNVKKRDLQRTRIGRTLALLLLLLSLATGLCAANAKEENLTLMWEEKLEKFREKYKYYLDESKTKAIDYEGRKYLQVYYQRNKVFMEQFWFVPTWREGEKGHWTIIIDIGNRKAFILDYFNKDHKPKEGHYDISKMKYNLADYSKYTQKLMQWMIDNRRTLLEEINRANGEASDAGFYASQPLVQEQSGARQGQSGAESNSPYVNDPNILKKEADQIQNWMNEGKIKAYNAGADFEWWDEKAKADFEALPFSDNIEEVASHVYRLTLDIKSPEEARYVVLVPRHVRVDRGGELEQFDSLTIVKIAERTVDYSTPDSKNRPVTLEPLTKMLDIFYIREGKTASIMHLGDHEYTWKWLEEGEKEVTEQSVGAMSTLASEVVYTFEGTADPNVIILNGVDDYDDSPVIGRLEVLPGVTTMLPPWYGE